MIAVRQTSISTVNLRPSSKAVLSFRASYGAGDVVDGQSPEGPLMPICPYGHRITLLLAEAGVPFEEYLIDGSDKTEWFLEAFPADAAPAMQGSPGYSEHFVVTGESLGGFDEILAWAKLQHPRVAAIANENGPLTSKQAGDLCGKIAFANFAGLMIGTKRDAGKGMMGHLFSAGGIATVEGESDEALRQRLIGISTEGLLELEAVLSALPGAFLGGVVQVDPIKPELKPCLVSALETKM